jgi:DNA-binding beta-propeller fold protein YncE
MAVFLMLAGLLAGPGPAGSLPDLAVLDYKGHRMVFLDPGSWAAQGQIALAGLPATMTVAADRRTAYVADFGYLSEPGRRVFVVDLAARAWTKTLDLGRGCRPLGLVLSPDDDALWVTCQQQESVVVVDLAAGAVTSEVEIGAEGVHRLALSPDGRRLYAACLEGALVAEIDVDARRLLRTIRLGISPHALALSPADGSLWVATAVNDLLVIDLESWRIVDLLLGPGEPSALGLTPSGDRVLAVGMTFGRISAYDVAKRVEVDRTYISPRPLTLLSAPDGAHAAIGRVGREPGIDLLRLDTMSRVGGTDLPFEPYALAWAPEAPGPAGEDAPKPTGRPAGE